MYLQGVYADLLHPAIVKSMTGSHPYQSDYWSALVTAVLQHNMQLKDVMGTHESANETEFKQLYESLQCTSTHKVMDYTNC